MTTWRKKKTKEEQERDRDASVHCLREDQAVMAAFF